MKLASHFYPIVDHPDWLERLLPAGVRLLQLRIKPHQYADRPECLRQWLLKARDLARQHDACLIINDHWQLAIDLQCDWVHLGQEDLQQADLGALRRAGIRLGVSTHDHEELEQALRVDPDYVALGPVWPTTLKVMPWAAQGLDRVREWKARIGDLPLVAIGGLNPSRGLACLEAGADAAAVVSDVLFASDPVARAREWLALPQAQADSAQ